MPGSHLIDVFHLSGTHIGGQLVMRGATTLSGAPRMRPDRVEGTGDA
jgi:hypothetical protein